MKLRAIPYDAQPARKKALGYTGLCGRDVSAATKVEAPQKPNPAPLTLLPGGTTGASARTRAFAVHPKYVRKCVNSAWTDYAPYHLLLWPRGLPGQASVVEAKCRSWRCAGECRRHQGKVLYARIAEALEPHASKDVVFAVLTLDRDGTYSGAAWADSDDAYRQLGRLSRNLMHRLNRVLGGDIKSRWVGVVEQHRTGWPHANLLIVSPVLASMLRAAREVVYARTNNWTDRCRAHMAGKPEGEACSGCAARLRELALVRGELLAHVVGAGWGPQSTMEVARDRGMVANYIVKTASLQDEAPTEASRAKGARITGEVVKLSQVPEAAPQGFRRLRSGRGFLPPKRRGTYTGALLDQGRPVKTPTVRQLRSGQRLVDELRQLEPHERRQLAHRVLWDAPAAQRARVVRLVELAQALEHTGHQRQSWAVGQVLGLCGFLDLADGLHRPP